ncbi:hypothetical protein HII13_001014 [Brettanomyces bruxellensis]|uniref:V-type proton ATPase subunit F n=1 Tax=Dekkera bruxellensis TaxID=5007 RepID=A0A3F2XZJ9_DEKBR|nr:uncharacterized protein BRETT_003262 [Brettanomyces bruxellensis]EIF48981.1 v-type atpase f [Brettanomyces bruxellensis AWRI1499]KAF6013767.1 hypothetical protein HII13_001014 [Brettanomyces bruxellensis]KAF6015901.1 hypothetical protein HII12_000464 [Brettanomyces bruxellensis]QOU23071.1 hypothetical protein BRETT_003262 [Brettanomyces bruxellensis]VUG16970.1 VMA7 [Brettanomyces bruxellensis]
MSASSNAAKHRTLMAAIGDEDTVTGILLAGIGQVTSEPGKERNFYVASENTKMEELERKFDEFINRDDVAILLINQFLADKIRVLIDTYTKPFPAILEIPSKDHPYDPEKDSILRRLRRLMGE